MNIGKARVLHSENVYKRLMAQISCTKKKEDKENSTSILNKVNI